ncbi:molybdopterin-guanine dinucleotide biosynthesis protein B [Paenibacillus sp. strain BS8-2]
MLTADDYRTDIDVRRPFVFQIVGYKNTGKTTLVCRLASLLKEAEYRVGTIKHDAHEFQMDHSGTDTWKHQQSGADITAIVSSTGSALVSRHPASLDQMIRLMADMDFILVEGYKHERYPKIVLIKAEADLELVESLSQVAAVALWPEAYDSYAETMRLRRAATGNIPDFPIDDAKAMLDFIYSLNV